MAVVQLSRIQVRRGQKKQGTGLPQLASGEFGWAIDTQELYIGNGSLLEGAPTVGNTKILTSADNIFALAGGYIYKESDTHIQTGRSSSTPSSRPLSERLDDTVTIKNFGVVADGITPSGDDFQRAIDQLFINTATKGTYASRIILVVDAGHYIIDRTIYIPPFATIIGHGPERTILEFTGSGPVFQTVNELSTPSNPAIDETAVDSATTTGNQPRYIKLADMTIHQTTTGAGLHLASCRDSLIENIDFVGPWEYADGLPTIQMGSLPPQTAIILDSLSPVVRTHDNEIRKCKISNFAYGIGGNQRITNNVIDKCKFNMLGKGVIFGAQSNGPTEIPFNNDITNSTFKDIHSEAIQFLQGTRNQSVNNRFELVGNYGGSEYLSVKPIIEFAQIGNESRNDYFSRTDILRAEFAVDSTYVAEIRGNVNIVHDYTVDILIPNNSAETPIVRFPAEQNQSYELEYYMYNFSYDLQRTGKLVVACDKTGDDKILISDEYDQIGTIDYEDADGYLLYDITFVGEFVNDGTSVDPIYSIYLKATNAFPAPIYFRYKLINHKIQF